MAASIALVEVMALLQLYKDDDWWQARTNQILVALDIWTGFGFIISTLVFYAGTGVVIYVASIVAFLLLFVMVLSHLWRSNQYLYKSGEKFVKNSSMLVMNVIKNILLLGGLLQMVWFSYSIIEYMN
ncbi:MAG: hypothetical protein ACFFEA_09155 [Candidatus Thorarchaeota archaeon]